MAKELTELERLEIEVKRDDFIRACRQKKVPGLVVHASKGTNDEQEDKETFVGGAYSCCAYHSAMMVKTVIGSCAERHGPEFCLALGALLSGPTMNITSIGTPIEDAPQSREDGV